MQQPMKIKPPILVSNGKTNIQTLVKSSHSLKKLLAIMLLVLVSDNRTLLT